jgi:hypothetical protein
MVALGIVIHVFIIAVGASLEAGASYLPFRCIASVIEKESDFAFSRQKVPNNNARG